MTVGVVVLACPLPSMVPGDRGCVIGEVLGSVDLWLSRLGDFSLPLPARPIVYKEP